MFQLDSAVGIEIGSKHLVVSTVIRGLRSAKIAHNAVIQDYQSLEPAQLRQKFEGIVNGNGFNPDNVVVGLELHEVVIRQVELPLEVEENLEQVVRFQVSKLQPTDDVDTCFDYLLLERDEKAKKITLQIILVPRETIDRLLELLGHLGLHPSALRVSTMGLHQLLRHHKDGVSEEPCIIVHLGESCVETMLVEGTARNFSFHKQRNGDEDVTDFVAGAMDGLLSGAGLRTDRLGKIYLTGSDSEELYPAMKERFGSVERLWEGMKLETEGVSKRRLGASARSVGLALSALGRSPLSRLNLIPADLRKVSGRLSYIPTVVLATTLLILLVLTGVRGYVQQSQLLAALTSEAERLLPQVESVMQSRETVDELSVMAADMSELLSGRQRSLSVLKELTELIPEDAYLQSLRVESSKVTMTGLADSASAIIPILQQSSCLTDVESKYITQDKRSGKDKFNFEARISTCAGLEMP